MSYPRDKVDFWHKRLIQQASWTDKLFFSLAEQHEFKNASTALEVGCGTGAALKRLGQLPIKNVMGLDLRPDFLRVAAGYASTSQLVLGDAHALPFADSCFDLTFCHFLLMWATHPLNVIKEMKRVTTNRGWVLALAEPDYDHRIDMPETLAALGRTQTSSLRASGADPGVGRRLAGLFLDAGIHLEATGLLGGYWSGPGLPQGWELEWQTIRFDLKDYATEHELDRLMLTDREAWLGAVRILFVPLFYAIGRVG